MEDMTLFERIVSLASTAAAIEDGECWSWDRAIDNTGYGKVKLPTGKTENVHRTSYRVAYGDIPDRMDLDHVCRNRACFRPSHLRVVTRLENIMADGSGCVSKANALKTHCKNGHPLVGDNVRYRMRAGVFRSRDCRTCARERQSIK